METAALLITALCLAEWFYTPSGSLRSFSLPAICRTVDPAAADVSIRHHKGHGGPLRRSSQRPAARHHRVVDDPDPTEPNARHQRATDAGTQAVSEHVPAGRGDLLTLFGLVGSTCSN